VESAPSGIAAAMTAAEEARAKTIFICMVKTVKVDGAHLAEGVKKIIRKEDMIKLGKM
jgi:hypothetical protein